MKNMQKTTDYYVVKQKAVPEVLLKVVEANRPAEGTRHRAWLNSNLYKKKQMEEEI